MDGVMPRRAPFVPAAEVFGRLGALADDDVRKLWVWGTRCCSLSTGINYAMRIPTRDQALIAIAKSLPKQAAPTP